MSDLKPSTKSKVKRLHQRGHYDRETIYKVLDAGLHCHVAYVFDGAPYCTPTFCWREGDRIYWHGSSASRFLRKAAGTAVCLTLSHLDGLVLARSGFHHSINYRSVMLFGQAVKVEDEAAKIKHMHRFMEILMPGRWDGLRPLTTQEIKATTVLGMDIDEGAAKIRTGQPVDDEEDYELPIWAGVVPLRLVSGEAQPDPRNLPGVKLPAHVTRYIKDHK